MIIPCDLALKQCLPCNDSPIANLSAEQPDVNVFVGFRDFKWNPPLGVTYFQLACSSLCFSTVSQQEADLCAQREAQSCVWKGGKLPVTPPQPPGPDNTGGKGNTSNTPGGVPPSNPRNPIRTFRNRLQTCDALCPDGSTFTEQVIGGTVIELSQSLADAKAKSLACKKAQQNLFCISVATPPAACVGETYFFRLTSSGGLDLIWSIDGVLPPGLNLNSLEGTITGTPLSVGSFTFTVEVTDSTGRGQTKVITICIMQIVTDTLLPRGSIGLVYAVPLIQQPATVSSEVWTLVSGSLPPGILLASSGSLTGIPTANGISVFTLKAEATCNGSAVSCQKAFTLEVVSCPGLAGTIFNAVWTPVSGPFHGTWIFNDGGNGTFNATALRDGIQDFCVVDASTTITNPNDSPCFMDVLLNYSQLSSGAEPGKPATQPSITFNGIQNFAFEMCCPASTVPNIGFSGSLFRGNGSVVWRLTLLLLPGPNTLSINVPMQTSPPAVGGTLSGTVIVEPTPS